MTQTIVGSITLGYRPLWNRARELAAVQLFVEAAQGGAIDAVHLVAALQELSSLATPQLLLSMHNRRLLSDMLAHAPVGDYWIEVRDEWLRSEPDIAERTEHAHARGLKLVWRGAHADWATAPLQHCFHLRLLTLAPGTVVQLQQAMRHDAAPPAGLEPGYLVEGVDSAAIASLHLDEAQALAVAGWPSTDVLRQHVDRPAGPDPEVLQRAIRAVTADQSLDQIEAIVRDDPVLAYRFLQFTNEAARGRAGGIESVRQGLLVLGYAAIGRWLQTQLAEAETQSDLQPVKAQMVLRARLTEHLLETGDDPTLRREVYVCGLFSELDQLLHESLTALLARLPLSERIHAATVENAGPYAPPLQLARALEGEQLDAVRALCRSHGKSLEEVNRQLLRTLVAARR